MLLDLSHTEITLLDRFNNINNRYEEFNPDHFENDQEIQKYLEELKIEYLRTFVMLHFKSNLYKEEDSEIKYIRESLNNFISDNFSNYEIPQMIIVGYVNNSFITYINSSYVISEEVRINYAHCYVDIIKYYNNLCMKNNQAVERNLSDIKNGDLKTRLYNLHFNQSEQCYNFNGGTIMKLIDNEYIIKNMSIFDLYFYDTWYIRHNKLIQLLNGTNFISILNNIHNQKLLDSNYEIEEISTSQVNRRLTYISTLYELVNVCPQEECTFLVRSIHVELLRIQCISLYLLETERESIIIPHFIPHTNILNNINLENICYLSKDFLYQNGFLDDIIDLIFYTNHIIQLIPGYSQTALLTTDNIGERFLFGGDLLDNIIIKMRAKKLEQIIGKIKATHL